MKLTVDTERPGAALGDLYGIFFEDLNHAADGGLYAELVQNGAFEFDPIDNFAYHALTAWQALGRVQVWIEEKDPAFAENPHHACISGPMGAGLRNLGFGEGICLRAGQAYDFSCWARGSKLRVSLQDEQGQELASAVLAPDADWQRLGCALQPSRDCRRGRLALALAQDGEAAVDFVSLFPQDLWQGQAPHLRRDLAEMLRDLQPKFLRFPGGCLVHDGTLNPHDRGSMYRWKNTIGPLERRPHRRSNWGCHQSLGLGFYEYFLLCEDLGAQPLPVLPGGCDPHHKRFAAMDELQPWIDDALDLIDFANGGPDTVWGARRIALGHPEPFHLKYLAVGNEEVGQAFFDRYPPFVRAIRAKAPAIQIVGTSGPFCAGSEYDRGWASARENHIDLVDEHYYMAPEWFIANVDRYQGFPQGPRVFLGEYASCGNTYWNALAEAAYMTGLERSAPAVALACYAPLFCHKDYVNWTPDLIWFDNAGAVATPNYYVQQLFMQNQGANLLPVELDCAPAEMPPALGAQPLTGGAQLLANESAFALTGITCTDLQGGAVRALPDQTLAADGALALGDLQGDFCLRFTARRLSGWKGMYLHFGKQDEHNFFNWAIGGWENQDCLLESRVDGRGSVLTQSAFSVQDGHSYTLALEVRGRHIRAWVDGALMNETQAQLPQLRPLYATASRGDNGEVYCKVVNLQDRPVAAQLRFAGLSGQRQGTAWQMAGYERAAENSFAHPSLVHPAQRSVSLRDGALDCSFPPLSLTVFRL